MSRKFSTSSIVSPANNVWSALNILTRTSTSSPSPPVHQTIFLSPESDTHVSTAFAKRSVKPIYSSSPSLFLDITGSSSEDWKPRILTLSSARPYLSFSVYFPSESRSVVMSFVIDIIFSSVHLPSRTRSIGFSRPKSSMNF